MLLALAQRQPELLVRTTTEASTPSWPSAATASSPSTAVSSPFPFFPSVEVGFCTARFDLSVVWPIAMQSSRRHKQDCDRSPIPLPCLAIRRSSCSPAEGRHGGSETITSRLPGGRCQYFEAWRVAARKVTIWI